MGVGVVELGKHVILGPTGDWEPSNVRKTTCSVRL